MKRQKSNLGPMQQQVPMMNTDLDELAQLAWLKRGVFSINVDSITDEITREFIRQFANEVYGKRQ